MRRDDWPGKRTGAAWDERFPSHDGGKVTFIEFLSPASAVGENANLRDPDLAMLWGKPDSANPPGDVDTSRAYLIGFTDAVDSAIYVDLRAPNGGRIIYDSLHPKGARHIVAFETIDQFVEFYLAQHDR